MVNYFKLKKESGTFI